MACSMCVVLAAVLSVLLFVLLGYRSHCQAHWRRRGIFTVPPSLFFGNFSQVYLRLKPFVYVIQDIYNAIKRSGRKFGGVFNITKPLLMVIDPELIRDIMVKHFDSFAERPQNQRDQVDPLYARTLLGLKGDEWRTVRHHVNPVFFSTKLRDMVPLMSEAARRFARFLVTRPGRDHPLEITVEMRRLVADLIATTAFGTVSDAINDPKSNFYRYSEYLTSSGGLRSLVIGGYNKCPALMKVLGIPYTPVKVTDFLKETVDAATGYRELENKSRADIIQLLLEARRMKGKMIKEEVGDEDCFEKPKDENYSLTNEDMVAQAASFMFMGYDTVVNTLGYCALELAANPDLQDRLKAEVDVALTRGEGKLSFEALQELRFMDTVIYEVLRLHPPTPLLYRVCTRAVDLPEYDLLVEEGTLVSIPCSALHQDPFYFPEPDKFDPDRFAEDNKHRIKPYTFLAFGGGPRGCIGKQVVMLEMKLALAYMIGACDLAVCARTQLPLRLTTSEKCQAPKGGFWITARPRDFPSIEFERRGSVTE